jgi:RNA polymerase sigma factor (sigma-70 family)
MLQLSDNELIQLYITGQNKAFEHLLSRHQKRIFSSILLLVNDRDVANDIFQDTFIKVIDNLKKGKYNDQGKFLPWVLRIAHNLSIDHFRAIKKAKLIPNYEDSDIFATLPIFDTNKEDAIIREQTCMDINALIELLPEEQKEVVVLRHFGDLSFQEIAIITNVSINTSLGRMRYALLRLRKLMQEKNLSAA